ncbi:phosphonate metabolism protein/1,5-bisphosphokinase (PRPP-forming) PhnN [Devosia sp. SD17-2]|uniref:phosphonate metabolism protein/1,5-bisphosphokinase (PRPP-forming) PhnN n=1 Tax=Devosia sp. SD17-2 TaxID=2976459 RepID=UPI0023D7DFAA|nr:phosphonate metabolism protein/1,5-bisphosphokinase (PRPP-forming) PhnN [Devosia sp. SD17-2]WEJ33106.1 phosphonate metabolism protein/1,5-bisphosphokinase (PRPP-forming) PhnN [Devosia sp. SD17-2]
MNERSPGILVLVVGPSGVGKDTLIQGARQALDADKRFSFVRRLVTRPTDVEVEDHLSVEPAEFEEARTAGRLSLHWEAHGLQYALPIGVDTDLALGRVVVANVSRHIVPSALEKYPSSRVVMISAEISLRAQRLASRGREGRDQITARLAREGATLPSGISPIIIDNSNSIGIGIHAFVMALRAIAGD